MDPKKPNKISEIVKLQQILKKWRKLANAPKNTTMKPGNKGIKFLKKTLSFSDASAFWSEAAAGSSDVIPKGFLAVCVGRELKRYIIPTEYLGHRAFGILLREAEEEFGFQQEGVLRIPCEVAFFEKILKVVEDKKEVFFPKEYCINGDMEISNCCSSEAEMSQSHNPQNPMCR